MKNLAQDFLDRLVPELREELEDAVKQLVESAYNHGLKVAIAADRGDPMAIDEIAYYLGG